MASDSLIDQYIESFRGRIRSRRDRDDLADEVHDHLLTAVERLEALGVDPHTAERRALARFGEPRLVASLLTEVPSKGSTMSLFFSRHLAVISVLAAIAWLAATVVAIYGQTNLLATWTQEAYLASSVAIAIACLLTTAVLIALNVRATGAFDASTVAIAVVGALSAFTAAMMSWVIAIWVPLLAIAVVWTLVRAWRTHAGSRPFAIVMIVLLPVVAVGAIVATAFGAVSDYGNELLGWAVFAAVAVVIAATFVDLAIRIGRRTAVSKAAVTV